MKISSRNLELMPEIKKDLKGLSSEDRDKFVLNYEKHNQLLDERRLAYVSFTRAKEKLVLTFAQEYSGKKLSPSIVLNEINFKNNLDIDSSVQCRHDLLFLLSGQLV